MFSDASMMIAGHGAAVVNALFLPQHAAVIEIFPYHIFMNAYHRMAVSSGLLYYPLYRLISLWSCTFKPKHFPQKNTKIASKG